MLRWAFAAALAAAIACGKAERTPEQACVPSDCAALGAGCGLVGDGCGDVIACGTCPAGQTCGAGGRANVCGEGACQPATCEARGATCGTVADGCGGALACGDCPAGETCGGGGEANACGKPAAACEEATCQAKGATCGTIPDGCGGELACGTCAEGDACGAGGTPNVCAPIPPTGAVRWAHAVSTPGPDFPVAAGDDAAGNRLLLTLTADEVAANHTLRLLKLGPDGEVRWTREWAARGFEPWSATWDFRMAVTPAGTVYLAASAGCPGWNPACGRSVDLGGGAATDSILVRLSADGDFEWQRELTGSDVAALAVNEQGSALVARLARGAATSRLEKYQWDGALLATVDGAFRAAALDDSGAMVGVADGSVARYSAAGALLWARDLPGGGSPSGAAVTAKGTVVVLASRTGDVSFGSSTVRSGGLVLYVLEADARPRFARGIAAGGTFLAVDRTGRAAVVGSSCGNVFAEAFDLANADLWQRALPDAAACWGPMLPGPASYGADHRLFLTGAHWGAVTIGGETFTPRGQDAIGVLLDP